MSEVLKARQEAGEGILALAADTSQKMDDENMDRQLLVEDLLTRLTQIGENLAPSSKGLFAELNDFREREAEYPLFVEKVKTHTFEGSYSGLVCGAMVLRNGYGEDCGLPPEHPVHASKKPQEVKYLISFLWERGSRTGFGRAFGTTDEPVTEELIVEWEKQIAEGFGYAATHVNGFQEVAK